MAKLTKFFPGLALGAMLALGTMQPLAAEEVTADTVVATVNGTNITLGHMIAVRDTLPANYQSLADEVLFKGILDQLVQQTALEQSVEGKLNKARNADPGK